MTTPFNYQAYGQAEQPQVPGPAQTQYQTDPAPQVTHPNFNFYNKPTTTAEETAPQDTQPNFNFYNKPPPTTTAETAPQDAELDKATLIVNYLPQSMTDEMFRGLFTAFGPLKNCKICRQKQTGWSYGFGFISYHTPDHAQKAIDVLNGHQVDGKRLKVAVSRPGGEQVKGANLYLRNVPKQMTEAELRQVFEPYGNIVNCRLLVDKATGFSRGCGFVLYDKKPQAQAALVAMSGAYLQGGDSGLIIRFADDNSNKVRPPTMGGYGGRMGGPGPIRPPMNRYQVRYNPMGVGPIPQAPKSMPGGVPLHVYNVGTHADQGNITALFGQFGTVLKVDIMWDYIKKQCKGFCFVTMATAEDAQVAIDNLNGYMFANRPLQVSLYTKKS